MTVAMATERSKKSAFLRIRIRIRIYSYYIAAKAELRNSYKILYIKLLHLFTLKNIKNYS